VRGTARKPAKVMVKAIAKCMAKGMAIAVVALGLVAPAGAQLQMPRGEPGAATGGIPPVPFGSHDGAATTLPDLPGVLPWSLLGAVKVVPVRDRFVPEFPASVQRLHRQAVKVQGFMMPLEPGEGQKHFLLTVTPQTCAFCIPAGPEGIVEVRTKRPVKVTFEPVVVSGRLEVLKDDPMGVFYRISDGEPVKR